MIDPAPVPVAPLVSVGRWAIAQASAKTGVSPAEIVGRSKARREFHARRMVCLDLRARGWSYARIGALLGRDHTTIIHAVRSAR